MSEALSGMLPIAVAIAVSPIPILAVILMLLTERSTANAVAFLLGWAAALIVIGGAVAALGIGRADSAEDPGTGLIVAQFALAAVLLAAAVRRWRMRARPGDDHETPKWMSAVRSVSPPRAFALGVGLIALNPKDGLLTVAAGARLAEADPGAGAAVAALLIFTAAASATIIAPILAEAAMGARAEPILERSRLWLERNGNAAVAVVLAVLGVLVAVDAARYV
jgi:threonine/homoserine/homoserine lactone efflux protein